MRKGNLWEYDGEVPAELRKWFPAEDGRHWFLWIGEGGTMWKEVRHGDVFNVGWGVPLPWTIDGPETREGRPAVAGLDAQEEARRRFGGENEEHPRVTSRDVDATEMRRLLNITTFGVDDAVGRFREVRLVVDDPAEGMVKVYRWRKGR